MQDSNREMIFGIILFILVVIAAVLIIAVITPITGEPNSELANVQYGYRVIAEGALGLVFLLVGLFILKKRVFFYPYTIVGTLLSAGLTTGYYGRAFSLLFNTRFSKTEMYDMVRLIITIVLIAILIYFINKKVVVNQE
jgi:hypothetical protein